jgi:hypothetical protein
MAAKLARLVYRMLRYGMKYVDQGARFYEAQHRNLQVKQLKWKAAKLGYQLLEVPAVQNVGVSGEQIFLRLARKHLSEHFPNPERLGCPAEEKLRLLGAHPRRSTYWTATSSRLATLLITSCQRVF